MFLADFGAEVTKLEPPGGDPMRQLPGFSFWNRNKRSCTVALGSRDAAERLNALVRSSDICVFSQTPAQLSELGIDPQALQSENRRAIHLRMLPFLETGPLASYPESVELLAAESGVGLTQYANNPVPIDPVFPHLLYIGAIWGAATAVAALVERERSGAGQTVTVTGFHSMLVSMTGNIVHRDGLPYEPARGDHGGRAPFYRLYQCADGEWLFLAALSPAFYTRAFDVLGVLESLLDGLGGELQTMALPANVGWVTAKVADAFRTQPREVWLERLATAGVPVGPVWPRERWFDHEQVRANEMRVVLEEQGRGPVEMPGISLKLSDSPGRVRWAAPQPGGTAPEPALPADQASSGSAEGSGEAPRGRPLAGHKVLDLGTIIAGTYAGSLLAELGADVVKVEPPAGDNLRAGALTFAGYNLGKRGIVLDLQQPSGLRAFERLVSGADVVTDNYRLGVLERLRIDYDRLARINPQIITASVTGYGAAGPWKDLPGFDPLLQALSGMMDAQGGDGPPVFFSLPVNDVASSAMATLGVVMALFHRSRTGRGQRVATSLAAQSLICQGGELTQFAGRPAPRRGGPDFTGPGPTDRYYAVKDGWVRLQAVGDADLRALQNAELLPPGALPTLETLEEILKEEFAHQHRDDVVQRLRRSGVPVAAARYPVELRSDSSLADLDILEPVDLVDGTRIWMAGRYVQFSLSPDNHRKPPPGLGEHTLEVLLEAGFSDEEVAALLEAEVAVQGGPFAC